MAKATIAPSCSATASQPTHQAARWRKGTIDAQLTLGWSHCGRADGTENRQSIRHVESASAVFMIQGGSRPAASGSAHTSEIPSDVAKVRPLLLQDHANAVTDAGTPSMATPRVLAFLREQLRTGCGQEVGYLALSLGPHREDLLVSRRLGAEDGRVESHLVGAGEDLADLVERLLHPLDRAAEPRVGGEDEVAQCLGQGPLVLYVRVHQVRRRAGHRLLPRGLHS